MKKYEMQHKKIRDAAQKKHAPSNTINCSEHEMLLGAQSSFLHSSDVLFLLASNLEDNAERAFIVACTRNSKRTNLACRLDVLSNAWAHIIIANPD